MRYELQRPENAQVVVRSVDDQWSPPNAVWVLEYDGMDGPPPVEAIQDLMDVAFEDEDAFPPFLLDRRQSYTEWGASGAVEAVVLSVLGALSYDLLKIHFKRLIKEVARRSTNQYAPNPITKEEAVERGRWRVASMFDVDGDHLVLSGVKQTADRWTVTYTLDNSEYEVKLEVDQGYPTIVEAAMREVR